MYYFELLGYFTVQGMAEPKVRPEGSAGRFGRTFFKGNAHTVLLCRENLPVTNFQY